MLKLMGKEIFTIFAQKVCSRKKSQSNKCGKDQDFIQNQVPHLTQDTTWESDKTHLNITNKSQEVSPFPAGDHKAAMNRRETMTNTRHKYTNDPQKKYRLGTVSKNILLEGLNRFHGTNLTLSSYVDQDT